MSKLTRALFSLDAKGSLGKILSLQGRGRQTIAEKIRCTPGYEYSDKLNR
jgi:hypothetical protein